MVESGYKIVVKMRKYANIPQIWDHFWILVNTVVRYKVFRDQYSVMWVRSGYTSKNVVDIGAVTGLKKWMRCYYMKLRRKYRGSKYVFSVYILSIPMILGVLYGNNFGVICIRISV